MNNYLEFSDEELMRLCGLGDKGAYATIYSRFWPLIYRFSRRMLVNDQEAEDVTQEVFYCLWNKAKNLQLSHSLSAYLYASARNRVLDRIAHGKVMERYTQTITQFLQVSESKTDYLVREKQLKELIELEVAALPEHMRTIFELSRKQNMSYREIADHLGISEDSVRGQVTRALKQLRRRLGLLIYIYFVLNNF